MLRVAALCAYLAAWLILAVAAVVGAIPRRQRLTAGLTRTTVPELVGMLVQGTAALVTALSMKPGPLRPGPLALAGTLALAPLAAVLFVWALRSAPSPAPNNDDAEALTTKGAYAWLRHPIYAAFLAMLVATGLLVSGGVALLVAIGLFLAGSEFRIASEELDLAEKFPNSYAQYRLRTRWRYLPGLR
jgi:protein-S-isoprenylcysteine O-methyltransferase Ste14